MLWIIILIAILLFILYRFSIEGYGQIWWNSSGTTRNMSYDLRGDPFPIPQSYFPFNNSSLAPIMNKPLWAVS